MAEKVTKEELLEKAKKPGEEAMKLHPFYKGKIGVMPKCCIRSIDDFAIWYTPGVAKPCIDIRDNPEKVFEHTNKANMIAVVSDGTRVLGLGDIGPAGAMPVMEGKALLFKYLGGVDAVPICLDTKDPDKLVEIVKLLQPTYGGINLEDISQPKCFKVLDTLRKECEIPVWHDDQQGTAAVTVAGLINALKIVGKDISKVKVAMVGAGSANICIARMIIVAGVTPGNIVMCDSKGILHESREEELRDRYKEKWELTQKTNGEGKTGGIPEAMQDSDVVIALSKVGPNTIKKEWVASMADDAIVFACANPIPEIWPWDAKEAGARVVATGRSDFSNQVNNSLGFPGIFRGTLDVMAKTITDEMCIAAARELAKCAEDKGMNEDYLIPTMDEWEVFPREAAAVGSKAIEQGVARLDLTREEIYDKAVQVIRNARESFECLQNEGFIKLPVK
ncbi:MAG TPA: NADP-dependent malic enzyme [Candidatus Krumholzibacteriaceae bacterium]|nr:NADP-dependent malic enzyme [Candidatus Krumholzibacteriaceae bacterium]